MVALFMIVLIIGSSQFYNRSTDSTIISGSKRDNSESLLLAESAMNLLMGRFVNTLDSDEDGTTDSVQAGLLQLNMTAPDAFLMPYMFYATNSAGLDVTAPTLLQWVANGEAANATAATLAQPGVPAATTQLRINDLFTALNQPKLYTLNNDGLIIESAAANWAADTNISKAAVWFEITENNTQSDAVDIYVQSVAQVGTARTYIQRYIGSYFANIVIGTVPALAEASNIDRGV